MPKEEHIPHVYIVTTYLKIEGMMSHITLWRQMQNVNAMQMHVYAGPANDHVIVSNYCNVVNILW